MDTSRDDPHDGGVMKGVGTGADKAIRVLLREAEAEGWTVASTKNNHLKLRHPRATIQVIVPLTPRNAWRTIKNTRAELRRALRISSRR